MAKVSLLQLLELANVSKTFSGKFSTIHIIINASIDIVATGTFSCKP
jgi:hypothetical protein